MKRAILILAIVAVVAVVAIKLVRTKPTTPPQASTPSLTSPTASNKPTLYLFRDPSDNDAGCRRIYEYADRAERELAGRVEVKRPDVKTEKTLVDKFQVRMLPTILIVSPAGEVQQRFEGEGEQVASRIENALTHLKETKE